MGHAPISRVQAGREDGMACVSASPVGGMRRFVALPSAPGPARMPSPLTIATFHEEGVEITTARQHARPLLIERTLHASGSSEERAW